MLLAPLLAGCAGTELYPFTALRSRSATAISPSNTPDLTQTPAKIAEPAPTPAVAANLPFVLSPPKAVAPFPIEVNRMVQTYVRRFIAHPAGLDAAFLRSRPYMAQMARVMAAYGVPRDLIYLSFAESKFTRHGSGPWQLTRSTARRYGLRINYWVDERRDPVLSTRAAAEYLADLHDQSGDWLMTLVGWNDGELGLDRFWRLRGTAYERMMTHLPRRTRALINRFMAVAFIAHNAEMYGMEQVSYYPTPTFRTVEIPGGTRLRTIAHREHTSVREIRALNPALLRDRLPPYADTYAVRVPLRTTAESARY